MSHIPDPPQPPAAGGTQPPAPGWWLASDGQWYPPTSVPGPVAAPVTPGYPGGYVPGVPMPKSRTTAGILGILLGGFGVHRFYLGYTSIGLLQILVTLLTCGVGSVWGLVEGILILVRNENFLTDANGVPLID
ncbi:unannotated protein [freshwater metagenome]|uniref:Unannotated protein n=1 Tax=freshwater metagenome TaxID=449393 RepID=A0A6J7JTX9_9ZZZZ